MGTGEKGEAEGIGVFLENGLHHLVGRLVEAGVDDLKTGVPEGTSNDLGTAVVTVESRLGYYYAIRALHRLKSIGRMKGCPLRPSSP